MTYERWPILIVKIIEITPRSMYYGTPVALIVTLNADGSENLAPMSSSWSLRERIVLGMGTASRTVTCNAIRSCPSIFRMPPCGARSRNFLG